MTRRGLLAAAIAAALILSPPHVQPAAAKRVGSYVTKGCKGAPTWRIAYRFYFRGAGGVTTSRGKRAKRAKRAAKRFARQVGRFSRCGVRARVDFHDEGNAVFDREDDSYGLPKWPRGANRFRRRGSYDAVFYRYPRQEGDDAPGYASWLPLGIPRQYGHVGFPVDDSFGADPEGRPWRNLVLHEWLHLVVHFYDAKWLPHTDSVHAGCQIEPYMSADLDANDGPCIASGTYFRDLMRGKVVYQGKRYGITRRTWRRCGTPTRPTKRKRKRCYYQ